MTRLSLLLFSIFVVGCAGRSKALATVARDPLELTVALEPNGKIAQATARPPRSETRPNCAD